MCLSVGVSGYQGDKNSSNNRRSTGKYLARPQIRTLPLPSIHRRRELKHHESLTSPPRSMKCAHGKVFAEHQRVVWQEALPQACAPRPFLEKRRGLTSSKRYRGVALLSEVLNVASAPKL